MALTTSQRAIIEKARTLGAGKQGVALNDEMCNYIVATIADDLGFLKSFPELTATALLPFFGPEPLLDRAIAGPAFISVFERLLKLNPDADTYFACLAWLHKSRLKYDRILQTQAIPSFDQVGPRGLLQYGMIGDQCLTPILSWRKWFFDIDNRAAQTTGYLFEPILAAALGGTPASGKRSPIRRHSDPSKRRQVNCIRDKNAYEFKIRLTIAASGQGRWQEELDFPKDCRESGYAPILIVLDPTPNQRLTDLCQAFTAEGGEYFIGDAAWQKLETDAGATMGLFLEKYVRSPIQTLLQHVVHPLPSLTASMDATTIKLQVSGETLVIKRSDLQIPSDDDPLPEDVDDQIPGP